MGALLWTCPEGGRGKEKKGSRGAGGGGPGPCSPEAANSRIQALESPGLSEPSEVGAGSSKERANGGWQVGEQRVVTKKIWEV
jgi:hypothetical protein